MYNVETKERKITLRISEHEKTALEHKATECGMSINQFIKHKIFDEDSNEDLSDPNVGPNKSVTLKGESSFSSIKFLDEHLPMLSRIIIDNYYYTALLADRCISSDVLDKSDAEAVELFKKLGIEKKVETKKSADLGSGKIAKSRGEK